ncbi:MAG: cupin domain-containing protein [Solirubrobacterales bacterium]
MKGEQPAGSQLDRRVDSLLARRISVAFRTAAQGLEGALRVRVDGIERELGAGDDIEIPREAIHQMWNPGSTPTRAIWRTSPPGRTEQWFRELGALQASGRVGRNGLPLAAGVRRPADRVSARLPARRTGSAVACGLRCARRPRPRPRLPCRLRPAPSRTLTVSGTANVRLDARAIAIRAHRSFPQGVCGATPLPFAAIGETVRPARGRRGRPGAWRSRRRNGGCSAPAVRVSVAASPSVHVMERSGYETDRAWVESWASSRSPSARRPWSPPPRAMTGRRPPRRRRGRRRS